MIARLVWAAMIAALAVTGSWQSAAARHRYHANDAAPGNFDYYLLSLSWSPAYCLQSPGAVECNGPRRYGFIVHGLWPQNERGWPEHCSGGSEVPESVVQGIGDLMPARGLVYHEWSTHGTCSGLDPAGFFSLVRHAYDRVVIPASFSRPDSPIEQSPAAIIAAFFKANPRLPGQSVTATCSGQGAPRLREVRICFNRDLTFRACSADALREGCRAASVIMPPIR